MPSTKTALPNRSPLTLEQRNLNGSTNDTSAYLPKCKRYQFARLLRHAPIALPHDLVSNPTVSHSPSGFGRFSQQTDTTAGKVKIILCVQQSDHGLDHIMTPDRSPGIQSQCLTVHSNRKQVTLFDPAPARRRASSSVPKIFKFDAVCPNTCHRADLCSLALGDAIRGVLRGQDGCILTIGHKRTGKTTSMLGSDQNPGEVGLIPCAIAWLYSALNQQRNTIGTRFAIRVSAVELNGVEENFRDLLAGISSNDDGLSPSHGQRSQIDPAPTNHTPPVPEVSTQDSVAHKFRQFFSIQSEIRASSMERAAYLLDIALRNRSGSTLEQSDGLSHMLFTLHVYQCRVENSEKGANVCGGRTRLHLLDLGCGRYGQHLADGQHKHPVPRAGPSCPNARRHISVTRVPTKSLSISGMASVILALLTGQRHLPYRDSALTHLLKESLTGNQILPCILAHVEAGIQYYTETLQIVQLVSKIGRLRRRRIGSTNTNGSPCSRSNTPSAETSSCTDSAQPRWKRKLRAPRLGRSSYGHSTSSLSLDLDLSSSSEQSCDTVIYLGQGRRSLRTNSAQPFRLHLAKLGPRGTADGSVDVESLSPGQLSEAELKSEITSSHGRLKSSHSVDEETSAMSRSVKRVMPRTNATAWPRITGLRKLNPSAGNFGETWIDGPVVMTDDARDHRTHKLPTFDAGQSRPITVSRSSTNPSISQSATNSSDTSEGSGSNIFWGGDEAKRAYPCTIPDTHNLFNKMCANIGEDLELRKSTIPSDNCPGNSHLLSSADSNNEVCRMTALHSTADNEHGRGNRALSDISEHTEETETNPEFNTIRSTSPADWLEQNKIIGLPMNSALDYWGCSAGMFGVNINQTNIPDLIGFGENQTPDIFNLATESNDKVNTNRSVCQPTAKRMAVPCLVRDPTTVDKVLSCETCAVDSKQNTNSQILFDGCGEQTVGMDGLETEEIPPKLGELSVNSSTQIPSNSCPRSKETRRRGDRPMSASASRDISVPSAQSKSDETCSPNAATQLRVAAWVNSLNNTSTPMLNCDAVLQDRPVQNHKRHVPHSNPCKGITAFGMDAANSPNPSRRFSASPSPVACNALQGGTHYYMTGRHMVRPGTQSQRWWWFACPEGDSYPPARTHSLRSAVDSGYGTVYQHAPFISTSVTSSPRLPHPAGPDQQVFVPRRNLSTNIHSTQFTTCMTGSHSNDVPGSTQARKMTNQTEEAESGKCKRFNVFRFFTLPIFRNLGIRKVTKTKKLDPEQTVPSEASPLLRHGGVVARPVVEPRGSQDPVTPIRLLNASFEPHEVNPIGVSTPSRLQPQNRRHPSPSQPRWDFTSFPANNQTTFGVSTHPQPPSGKRPSQNDFIEQTCQSANSPVYRNGRAEHEVGPAGMAPNTNANFTLVNYTGGLCASASRSGRRSITGGAASSGYESMRIGTSDLSLSHPDSASECSGRVSQGFFTKDNSGQLRDRTADLIR